MKDLLPLPDLTRAASLRQWLAEVHRWMLSVGGEFSLAAAAARAGMSPSHLNNLLCGRRPFLTRHVEPLGRALRFDARQTEALAALAAGRRPSDEARATSGVASEVDLNRALLREAPSGTWAARASLWTLDAETARVVFAAGQAAICEGAARGEGARIRFFLRAFPVTTPEEKYSMEARMSLATALTTPLGGATVPVKMTAVLAPEEPDILDFLDYREFLSRYLEAAQARNHRLSNRWLGLRLGVSGAQVANVLARRRKLDRTGAAAGAAGLGLTGDRAEYFPLLVEYNDTTDSLSAVRAWRGLCLLRARNGRPIEEQAGSVLLLRWYIPVILELSMRPGWRDEPTWIATRLCPEITPAQAADAVALLRAAGLLPGKVPGPSPVARAPQWLDAALVARFHDECLDVASDTAALGVAPWQHVDLTLDLHADPAALSAAAQRWRSAVEGAARAATVPSHGARTHLFLAHAFRVDTPPP